MTRWPEADGCAGLIGAPSHWTPEPCPFSPGEWLVSETDDTAVAVVAPGVTAGPREGPYDRLHWRLVTWAVSAEVVGEEAAEADMQVGTLGISTVLSLVGPERKGWVRDVSRAQLRHLESFGSTRSGQPHEDRSRRAAEPLSRLRAELAHSFPGETWHAAGEPESAAMPDTAAAFLRSVDGPPAARADRVFERLTTAYYALVELYRDTLRRRSELGRALRRRPSAPPPSAASGCERDDEDREPALGA